MPVKDEKVLCSSESAAPRALVCRFVSKAIGVPLAKLAAKVMAGKTLKELGFTKEIKPIVLGGEGIRLPVQPFFTVRTFCSRRKCARPGEVMGLGWPTWALLMPNRKWRAGAALPLGGKVFISVSDAHKKHVLQQWQTICRLEIRACGDGGTAAVLEKAGLKVERIVKLLEGPTKW